MIAGLAARAAAGGDLAYEEAGAAVREALAGAGAAEVAGLLGALADKGETDDELLGMLDAMMGAAVRAEAPGAIDVCGTGGDGLSTFNASTAAAFIAAAAGARVAKHGNRSSSGGTGSADIFERLGCDLRAGPAEARASLERHGICFLFAQRYHPAMARVAGARRMLGRRTAFNLLGPLANPAGVSAQLVGVPDAGLLRRIPAILGRRGAERAMAVRSGNGADELETGAANEACSLGPGGVSCEVVRPEDLGLRRSGPGEISVGGPDEAFSAFAGAVAGTARRAVVETAALNAGGALAVTGLAPSLGDGVRAALDTVKDGGAWRLLEGFVRDAGDAASLEGVAGG